MTNGGRGRIDEFRPSQILFAYGVGTVVDLPHSSAIKMWRATLIAARP